MRCANCQAPLSPDDRFCGDCGRPVSAPPRPVGTAPLRRPPPKSSGSNMWLWLSIGCAVIVGVTLLGVCGLFAVAVLTGL